MEHAELAAAIRLLRSRAESDSAESPDGSSGGSSVRGGICIVSRDAAREAPDSPLGLQHGVSFAGISRGREAFCGIRTRASHPGPAGELILGREADVRREAARCCGGATFSPFGCPCTVCRFFSAFCRRLRRGDTDLDSAGKI